MTVQGTPDRPRETLFSQPVMRTLAATLGVLLTATVVTTAMPSYLPLDEANGVVLPIVLFPVTWCALFIWSLLDGRIWRVWTALLLLTVVHGLLIAKSLGAL